MTRIIEEHILKDRGKVMIFEDDSNGIFYGRYRPLEGGTITFANRKLDEVKKELRETLSEYFTKLQIEYQNKANDSEALAVILKENDFKKASEYVPFQTLQSKNAEGGN